MAANADIKAPTACLPALSARVPTSVPDWLAQRLAEDAADSIMLAIIHSQAAGDAPGEVVGQTKSCKQWSLEEAAVALRRAEEELVMRTYKARALRLSADIELEAKPLMESANKLIADAVANPGKHYLFNVQSLMKYALGRVESDQICYFRPEFVARWVEAATGVRQVFDRLRQELVAVPAEVRHDYSVKDVKLADVQDGTYMPTFAGWAVSRFGKELDGKEAVYNYYTPTILQDEDVGFEEDDFQLEDNQLYSAAKSLDVRPVWLTARCQRK